MTPEEIAKNKKLQAMQWKKPFVPTKCDIEGIIKYLHEYAGQIPTENECLRFHLFLQTHMGKPSEKECSDFLTLLGMVRK